MLACCRKVRTEEIASTITAWEDRGISGIGDATSLVTHQHPEARRRGVRWVVKGVKYMLIVALFRALGESLRMALQKPKQPYTFTFNDVMKPIGGYVEGEYNTGDVFKFDTRIPKKKTPPPRYYTPPKNEKGESIPTKPLSESSPDDDIETIYLDDNLYTNNEQEGSMVAFTYKKMESEDGSDEEPKYHIVGMSFSDTPLEGQLAHIRRVTEPDMKRSAIAPRGLSRASSDGTTDMAIDFIDAPPNIGDWRTLNGISINDGDDKIKGVLEEQKRRDARSRKSEGTEIPSNKQQGLKKLSSKGGRKKMKRKRKKTRRKKQKGGKKKTKNKRKRKRKKTRRKQKIRKRLTTKKRLR